MIRINKIISILLILISFFTPIATPFMFMSILGNIDLYNYFGTAVFYIFDPTTLQISTQSLVLLSFETTIGSLIFGLFLTGMGQILSLMNTKYSLFTLVGLCFIWHSVSHRQLKFGYLVCMISALYNLFKSY